MEQGNSRRAESDPDDRANAEAIYQAVHKLHATTGITAASVVTLTTAAMTEAEKIPALRGQHRKSLVVHVIGRIVDEVPDAQEDKAAIRAAVTILLPSVIDAVATAAAGGVAVNRRPAPAPRPRARKCCCLF